MSFAPRQSNSPTDITTLPGNHESVAVFEGFFDFLSWVNMQGGKPEATALILNSTSMQQKAAAVIRDIQPRSVELYRDHDPAGVRLLAFFREALPGIEIVDEAPLYSGCKDLNEWHAQRLAAKAVAH